MKATRSQIEDAVYSKFDSMSSEYGFDVDEVEGVYLHGSRLRGTANQNSDLDAVVFYIGNESEDYIFNTINDGNNLSSYDRNNYLKFKDSLLNNADLINVVSSFTDKEYQIVLQLINDGTFFEHLNKSRKKK